MKEDLRILGGGCPRWGENPGSDCSLAASRNVSSFNCGAAVASGLYSTSQLLGAKDKMLRVRCTGPC